MKEPSERGRGTKPPQRKKRLIAFVKKDKKASISSTTHNRVLEPDDDDDGHFKPRPVSLDLASALIRQEDLERWLLRWKYFREMDDWIASALHLGVRVEHG